MNHSEGSPLRPARALTKGRDSVPNTDCIDFDLVSAVERSDGFRQASVIFKGG